MRKITLLISVLVLSVLAFAQTNRSGTVRDQNGNPIPFATVSEVGKNNTVQADANGAFAIKVIDGAQLRITATGHQPQTVTVSGAAVSATLTQTDAQLSEVVVTTAFGIRRSQRITPYSSQVITSEQLKIVPQTNLTNALAGKVAGVQFRGQSPMKLGSQGFLRIRGGIDLNGDIAPVYVIDGTITSSFDINPDDVQDVTVLKGANATVLLGDLAKGGAIIITTKKAPAGRTTVEVSQGLTFDKVYVLPEYQNLYAGGDGDLRQFTWQAGMPDAWKPLDGKYYHDFTDDASWGPRMVGQEYIPWYAFNPNNPESGKTARLVAQPDNSRDFYNTGITSTTNVAFGKSTQGASYRISYTNNSIRGMLPNTSSYRNTLFLNTSIDISSHLTAGANLSYSNNVINGQFSDAYSNQSSGSFNSWFHRDLDMNKLKEYRGIKTPIGTYQSWNLGANPGSASSVNSVYKANYWYNFFSYFDLINNTQNRDYLVGNASLTYKINNNIKVTGTVRKNTTTNRYEFITPSELETSGSQTQVLASYQTGQLKEDRWQYDAIASFNKSFINNKLSVNLNAGGSDYRYSNNTVELATKNGLNVPGLYAISNSKDQATLTNTRSRYEIRALFVSGDIEWNRMVNATFAIRKDWYSVLLPENNSLLSPSAGVSFFFTDLTKGSLPWLSFGKVFGSWGKKPTSGLNPYQTNFTYTINQNKWGNNFLTNVPNQAIDPKIQGALLTTYETGIDLRFINNRYGINIVYYDETSKNAPFAVPISGYSGFNTYLTNVSLIKRKGIEIEANAKVMARKDFSWDITKTFSYLISNPVVETDTSGNRIQIASGAFFSGIVPPKVYQVKGKSWGRLIGTAIKRNAEGLAIINPTTGAYVTEANHDFGSVVPRLNGGIVNTFTYKSFTLNFNIDYQFGGKFFSLSEMWGHYSGLLKATAATNDRGFNVRDAVVDGGGVHVVGVSSVDEKTKVDMYVDAQEYFHGLGSGNAIGDPYVHSLSYVKLREVGVGYNFPISKWNWGWVKGLNLTVVARNPLLLYRETRNFDPSEISNVQGEDGQYPGTRSLGFNLKFNF